MRIPTYGRPKSFQVALGKFRATGVVSRRPDAPAPPSRTGSPKMSGGRSRPPKKISLTHFKPKNKQSAKTRGGRNRQTLTYINAVGGLGEAEMGLFAARCNLTHETPRRFTS